MYCVSTWWVLFVLALLLAGPNVDEVSIALLLWSTDNFVTEFFHNLAYNLGHITCALQVRSSQGDVLVKKKFQQAVHFDGDDGWHAIQGVRMLAMVPNHRRSDCPRLGRW